ncbi:hypothetical protein GCM10009792_18470 [Microcella alkalica]
MQNSAYPHTPARWSPLRRAMVSRDFDLLMEAVHGRSTRLSSGCLVWNGARSELGYGRALRGPIVSIHRLVAWGAADFPGDLSDFPAVHHRCQNRACAEPSHLAGIGARANAVEAFVRNGLYKRIGALEAVIRELDPSHPILRLSSLFVEVDPGDIPDSTFSVDSSLSAQVRQRSRFAERERKRLALQSRRFGEVLEARRMISRGATRSQAARALHLDLSTLAYWEQRLDENVG